MKIIFMGTPEFAAVILSHLADSEHKSATLYHSRTKRRTEEKSCFRRR